MQTMCIQFFLCTIRVLTWQLMFVERSVGYVSSEIETNDGKNEGV